MNIFPIDHRAAYITNQVNSLTQARSETCPIVIDHGSWQCRAGYAGTSVRPQIEFDNYIVKTRGKAGSPSEVYVGPEVEHCPDKSSGRSAFDATSSVVVHPEMLHYELDYIFKNLGISSNELVSNPVVMTEAVCNIPASRKMINEVLFEYYQVPAVTFGVDCLFSCYKNQDSLKTGIIISSGHHSTHIIPVVNGKWVAEHCKRLPIGGFHTADYMLKLLQLKYHDFPLRMNLNQAQVAAYHHTYIPEDYRSELKNLENFEYLSQQEHILQFSYESQTKAEQEEALKMMRRDESRQRMKEHAERQRLEKLQKKQSELVELENILSLKQTDPQEFDEKMEQTDFNDESELLMAIEQMKKAVKKIQNKIEGIEEEPEPPKQAPDFSLVEVPDDQLDDDQKKEKKKQRLLKAGWVARERIRKQKEELKKKREEEERLEEERRLADPQGWVEEIREKRAAVIRKIKEKKKLAQQTSSRRGTSSKNRLKTLASMAEESNLTQSGRQRKKRRTQGDDDDGFGMNDDDWLVYREIQEDEEDEEEENDQQMLEHYENLLMQFDDEFVPAEDLDIEERKKSFFYQFKYGPNGKTSSIEEEYQMRLNIERIKVPEILFEPHIMGLDNAGISEILISVLNNFDPSTKSQMLKNIFITGTHSAIPGLDKRIERDLRIVCPEGSKINVGYAHDPRRDAWHGAAKWADEVSQDPKLMQKYFISKQEFEEQGLYYMKDHPFANPI